MRKLLFILFIFTSLLTNAQQPFYGDRKFVSYDGLDTLFLTFVGDSITISSTDSVYYDYLNTRFNNSLYVNNNLYVDGEFIRLNNSAGGFRYAGGSLKFLVNGGVNYFETTSNYLGMVSGNGGAIKYGLPTATNPTLLPKYSDTNTGIGTATATDDQVSIITGGVESVNIKTDTVNINGYIKPTDAIHLFSYFVDSTVTFNFASSDTWYHLTNTYNELYDWSEIDGFSVLNDTITVTESGDYDLSCHLGFEGTNGQTYAVRFFNVTQAAGIPTDCPNTARGPGNIISVNVSAYAHAVNAGDKIVLQIKNDGTGAATLKKFSNKNIFNT